MKRKIIDCRRLLCPMPVIRVQTTVESLPDGAQIEAICTDPGVLTDIPAWSRINGHKLIEAREEDGEYIVVVEVDHGMQ
ncbi:MAG: sulfurtransferase TusA family protein [Candidatus Thiodiazotropha sp. (ex Monitilora ramsayi)]|nr:sulfurtransferase TusA family protein [Candidatus Thiodiazotropha sp. (ex Monitilora ramsayi)]